MSEQVGERKGSGPFKEGTIKNACYEVLKNAGSRGLTVRTRARASFIPSRTPPSSPPIVRLLKKQEIIDGQVLRDSLPFERALQVSDIVQRIRSGGLAKLGGATPANTIVGQLSKGTRAARRSQRRPSILKKKDAPRLTLTLQLCDRATLTFSPPPPLFAQTPTSCSCARRRTRCIQVPRTALSRDAAFSRARAAARASLGPVLFFWLGYAGITRKAASAAHPCAEGALPRERASPPTDAPLPSLPDQQNPPSWRATPPNARVSRCAAPSLPPLRAPPPRGAVESPEYRSFSIVTVSRRTRLRARVDLPRDAREI